MGKICNQEENRGGIKKRIILEENWGGIKKRTILVNLKKEQGCLNEFF